MLTDTGHRSHEEDAPSQHLLVRIESCCLPGYE